MPVEDYLLKLAPEWLLLIGGCVALAAGVSSTKARRAWPSVVALFVLVAALAATIALGQPEGDYAPLGLWLTSLTFYTRCIALGVGILIILVNWHQPVAEERGEYVSMILFSLLGVLLTASANDWIALFFAIELVSIPTYVLIALSRRDSRASEAAVKYFFLGGMAAAILAYGFSFLYGAAGTTTIQMVSGGVIQTHDALRGSHMTGLTIVGLVLVLSGLGFKIAAVPFHVYAPDVYEGAASPVTGMIAFVPKLAGFIALVKVFAACSWDLPDAVMWVVWGMAAVSMTVGNVLALLQRSVKRMLAYSSIAHTGYMLIALLVGPVAGSGPMQDGVAALLFYVGVYGAMNLGAFALLAAFRSGDRDTESLDDLSGLARRAPWAALAFAVCVFSLMGFPPTAGFLGKVYIFASAFSLSEGHAFHRPLMALAVIGVVNSAIGAAYYLRLVGTVYMGDPAEKEATTTGGPALRWGLALCSIPLLILFAWPAGLAHPARNATTVLHKAMRTTPTHVASTVQPTEIITPASGKPSQP